METEYCVVCGEPDVVPCNERDSDAYNAFNGGHLCDDCLTAPLEWDDDGPAPESD